MQSLLVVCTSFNNLTTRGEASLERALSSLRVAVDNLRTRAGVRAAVSWVDDGSSDGTDQWLSSRLDSSRDEWFLHNETNRFIGFARNQAAARIDADVIATLDSDDEMYPDHLLTGWHALNEIQEGGKRFGWCSVLCAFGGCEDLHPEWERRIAATIPSTKFFLRRVWDFVEGFPADEVYRWSSFEDQDMSQQVATFFPMKFIERRTLRYWSYPGNSFARQMARFQCAPDDPGAPAQPPAHTAAWKLRARRLGTRVDYLKNKLERLMDYHSFDDLLTTFRAIDDAGREAAAAASEAAPANARKPTDGLRPPEENSI